MPNLGEKTKCRFCGTSLIAYSQIIHDHWVECKRVNLKAHDEATVEGKLYARDYWEALNEDGTVQSDQWPELCDNGEVLFQPLFSNNLIVQYPLPLETPDQEYWSWAAEVARQDQEKAKYVDQIRPKTEEFIALLEQAGFQDITQGWGTGWTDYGTLAERYHIRASMPRKYVRQRYLRRKTKGKKLIRVTYTFFRGRWQGQWGARSPRRILQEIAK